MENSQPNNLNSSDEIDLGQLLQLVKKGFYSLGNSFLRIFIYLRRNAFKLAGLVLLGIAISFGLSKIVSMKLKTDVIVRPNFESKNYLYDVIEEVLSENVKTKNVSFFKELNIPIENLEGFKVEVKAIEDEEKETDDALNEMQYLEVLQNFKDESFVIDILRSKLSEKSVVDHKITFIYKDATSGPEIVQKMIDYINTNKYYNDLQTVYSENAKSHIEENNSLIKQIDLLVENYSKALLNDKDSTGGGTVYMEKEKTLNMPALLSLKNELHREVEEKRVELSQQTGVISIINFGKTQEIKKSFFNQIYFLIPAILLGGFFLLSFFKYLNRKSKEIE